MGSREPVRILALCLLVAYSLSPICVFANNELLRVDDDEDYSKFISEVEAYPTVNIQITGASLAQQSTQTPNQGKIEMRNLSTGQLIVGPPSNNITKVFGGANYNVGEALAKGDGNEILVGGPGPAAQSFWIISNYLTTLFSNIPVFTGTPNGVTRIAYPGSSSGQTSFGEEIVVFRHMLGQTLTTFAAVAAPGVDEVFIFQKNMTNGQWSLKFRIDAPNSQSGTEFGQAMAVGDVDGNGGDNDLIIGAPDATNPSPSGAVYIYYNVGGLSAAPTVPNDTLVGTQLDEDFGYSVAYESAGKILAVGATKFDRTFQTSSGQQTAINAGTAYVYQRGISGFNFLKHVGAYFTGALAGEKVATIAVSRTSTPPVVDVAVTSISGAAYGSIVAERVSGQPGDVGRLTFFVQPVLPQGAAEVGRFFEAFPDRNQDSIPDLVYGAHSLQQSPFIPSDNFQVVSEGLGPVSGIVPGAVTQSATHAGCIFPNYRNLNFMMPTLQVATYQSGNTTGMPNIGKRFKLGIASLRRTTQSLHEFEQASQPANSDVVVSIFCGDNQVTSLPAPYNACDWPNGGQWYKWDKVLSSASFSGGNLMEEIELTGNMPTGLVATSWSCGAHITKVVNGNITDWYGFARSVDVTIGNQ